MRVLQLIDSLNSGGAERMAVSLANSLANKIDKSFLCATREEGALKKDLKPEVSYFFLEKRGVLDFSALLRLRKFIKQNNIGIVHAHSTSYFFAALLKVSGAKVKIFWHDHYGNSELLNRRKHLSLKFFSRYFQAIISVNKLLKTWAEEKLGAKNVFYLSNFVSFDQSESSLVLKGSNSLKIICVANLRPQKDHLNLLEAFKIIQKKNLNVSLHFIGARNDRRNVALIESFIIDNNLSNVYIYGSQSGIQWILKTADIAVLSSVSEGLPISLLEYGAAGLPVVCTDVGQCKEVVNGFGKIVPPKNAEALAAALLYYIENEEKRIADGAAFSVQIAKNYAEDAVIPKLLNIYKNTNR